MSEEHQPSEPWPGGPNQPPQYWQPADPAGTETPGDSHPASSAGAQQPYWPPAGARETEPSWPATSAASPYSAWPPGASPYSYWTPPPPVATAPHRRSFRPLIAGGVAAALAVAGVGFAVGRITEPGSGQAAPSVNVPALPGSNGGQSGGGTGGTGNGGTGNGGTGNGGTGNGGSSSQTAQSSASAAQQAGVVDITTALQYQSAEAAGTGMVLTSNGEILTNNHVVDGATSIKVTVVTTGKTYTATVVGTDPTQDVAVLQLKNASGLQTAHLGNSSAVNVGAQVTGVGNAGGVGGTPNAASGSVLQLNQTITAADSNGSNAQTLTGLIETNAPIQAGDSGGPLYSSSNQVVGMDTAASTAGGGRFPTGTGVAVTAYAIPINTAVTIANEIESGHQSSTIHIGYPGFLGVSITAFGAASGAEVSSVVNNGPAANAGISPGDVITAVGGSSVTSADSLKTALAGHHSGDRLSISWTDTSGQSHTATLTLIQGPAD
jgi:S1-C subfamily serine protease